jgi:hypothetical protein
MTSDYILSEDFPIIAEKRENWVFWSIENIIYLIREISEKVPFNVNTYNTLIANFSKELHNMGFILEPSFITRQFVNNAEDLEFTENKCVIDKSNKQEQREFKFHNFQEFLVEYEIPFYKEREIYFANSELCIELTPELGSHSIDYFCFLYPQFNQSDTTRKEKIIYPQLSLLLQIQLIHLDFMLNFFKEICNLQERIFYKLIGYWFQWENICKKEKDDFLKKNLNQKKSLISGLEDENCNEKKFKIGFLAG